MKKSIYKCNYRGFACDRSCIYRDYPSSRSGLPQRPQMGGGGYWTFLINKAILEIVHVKNYQNLPIFRASYNLKQISENKPPQKACFWGAFVNSHHIYFFADFDSP